MRGRRWVVGAAVAVAVLAGCDGDPSSDRPPTGDSPGAATPTGTDPSPGRVPVPSPSCPPDSRYADVMAAGGEMAGTPGVFWGLLFPTGDELTAGERIKIAFKVTGTGDLTLRATGPDGAAVPPASGPDHHDGSTWERVGDEWGSTWIFPTPGCWTIQAERTDGTRGALTLRVG